MSLHTCLHSPYSLCRSFILCTCLVLHILHLFAQSIFFTINILSLFVQSIFCICLHSPYFVLVAHAVFSFAQTMFCLFVCPALYLFCTVCILCLFAYSLVGFWFVQSILCTGFAAPDSVLVSTVHTLHPVLRLIAIPALTRSLVHNYGSEML